MATHPGQVVLVDMMHSPTPGLIAQMGGWLTNKCYRYTVIYVNHFSGYWLVHLQKTQTAENPRSQGSLRKAKSALWCQDPSLSCCQRHLHLQVMEGCLQGTKATYSYSGVNAHFQSGVAEHRVQELQELGRIELICAQRHWKEALSSILWPSAVVTGGDVYNEAPTTKLQ
jgi:hypothetical protein